MLRRNTKLIYYNIYYFKPVDTLFVRIASFNQSFVYFICPADKDQTSRTELLRQGCCLGFSYVWLKLITNENIHEDCVIAAITYSTHIFFNITEVTLIQQYIESKIKVGDDLNKNPRGKPSRLWLASYGAGYFWCKPARKSLIDALDVSFRTFFLGFLHTC